MLIDHRHQRRAALFSGIAAGIAVVSAIVTLTHVEIYDDALPRHFLAGTLGFDVMSLAAGLGLLASIRAIGRGRIHLWLVWLGLQAYLLYAYAIVAFGFVHTPLYFAYLAIVGSSTFALGVFARGMHLAPLRRADAAHMPRRLMAGVLIAVAALFAILWSVMVIAAITDRVDLPAAPVVVLDLTFALPLLVIVAVLILRRHALGDLLAPGVFAMSAAITLAVALGELLTPFVGGDTSLVMTLPYLLPGLICLALAVVAFRRVKPALQRPETSPST